MIDEREKGEEWGDSTGLVLLFEEVKIAPQSTTTGQTDTTTTLIDTQQLQDKRETTTAFVSNLL